ncbi:MAG: hypothetical protein A3H97_24325 [Acidobacteria bacterium RIFCSPLOWO2_02_FULL_65_29]|nr:MAG: hypothetical protein A3H97_24325 [Acidobacteria bacterium RIFCSPLOWO2_02_FULL_65_29]
MNVNRWIVATAAGLVAALGAFAITSLPALAHHASGPFYDSSKRVEMQGAVTRFVFKNPHATLYVDAADDKGQTIHWQIELGAPASLVRTGWTPDTLKAGVMIKVSGQPSRAEGTYGMCCARITKIDGSPIVSGGRVQEEVQPPR